jgi:hypothetical protein
MMSFPPNPLSNISSAKSHGNLVKNSSSESWSLQNPCAAHPTCDKPSVKLTTRSNDWSKFLYLLNHSHVNSSQSLEQDKPNEMHSHSKPSPTSLSCIWLLQQPLDDLTPVCYSLERPGKLTPDIKLFRVPSALASNIERWMEHNPAGSLCLCRLYVVSPLSELCQCARPSASVVRCSYTELAFWFEAVPCYFYLIMWMLCWTIWAS